MSMPNNHIYANLAHKLDRIQDDPEEKFNVTILHILISD